MRLTASSLWRAEKCPASASLPAYGRISADSERGRDEHAKLEAAPPPGGIPEVALVYNLRSGQAREVGRGADVEFPPPEHGDLRARIDLLTLEPEYLRVTDYKSGHGFNVAPPVENLQLAAGAIAACAVYDRQRAVVEIQRTDGEGEPQRAALDELDLAAARERIRRIFDAAVAEKPRVVEGDHCWRCPCYSSCPPKLNLALAVATGKLPDELPVLELTRESLAAGWPKLKAFKKLLGEVERIYRGYAWSEPVPLGNGKWLGQVSKPEDEIDGPTAMKVLRELHGVEVAATAVEIATSKAGVERGIALVAPKGKKAALVRAALDQIAAAGGITRKFRTSVEEYESEEEAQNVREG